MKFKHKDLMRCCQTAIKETQHVSNSFQRLKLAEYVIGSNLKEQLRKQSKTASEKMAAQLSGTLEHGYLIELLGQ